MATLTSTKACRACTYWYKTGADQGECRRHAPQTIVFKVDQDMKFESHFPVTKGEDCIQCYFKLYGIAAPDSEDLLRPLKVWIESNIEVIAKDGREQILEQLPLRLDAPDLEAYCQDVIHEFRTNRVYPSQNLTLEFRYKEAA
jgi:hypothetical protein